MNRSWAMWKTPNNMCQNHDCSQARAGWGRDEGLGPRPREFCVCCLIPKCQEKVASRPSLSFPRDKMGTEWVRGGLWKNPVYTAWALEASGSWRENKFFLKHRYYQAAESQMLEPRFKVLKQASKVPWEIHTWIHRPSFLTASPEHAKTEA